MNEEVNNNNNENEEVDDDNIIVLNDEDGKEVQFEFLDLIEYNGEEYVVLLPMEENLENDEPGEVVILKLEDTEEDSEMESYVSVDDDEVLQKVFEMFKDKFKNDFDFVD